MPGSVYQGLASGSPPRYHPLGLFPVPCPA